MGIVTELSASQHQAENLDSLQMMSLDAILHLLILQQQSTAADPNSHTVEVLKTSFTQLSRLLSPNNLPANPLTSIGFHILSNNDFGRLIITESIIVSVLGLNILDKALAAVGEKFHLLSSAVISGFLDELSFKISATEDPVEAAGAMNVLLRFLQRDSLLKLVKNEYDGLTSLTARWAGHGFDASIRQLLKLLSYQNEDDTSNRDLYATKIQKHWRGWRTRKRLGALTRIVSNVQRAFRARQNGKKEAAADAFAKHLAQKEKASEMSKLMRQSREKRLEIVSLTPASEVDALLCRSEVEAAVVLQRRWRGWRVRRDWQHNKATLERHQSARIIQRCVRSWLRQRRVRRIAKTILEDTLRPEFRDKIRKEVEKKKEEKLRQMRMDKNEGRPSLKREDVIDLDSKVQKLLLEEKRNENMAAKTLLRCKALQSSLAIDVDLLMLPSSIDDLLQNAKDPLYRRLLAPSSSSSIRAEAARQHHDSMDLAKHPWKKVLRDTTDDYGINELVETAKQRLNKNPHWNHLMWTSEEPASWL